VGAAEELRARLKYMLGGGVRIFNDRVVPQPKNGPTLLFKECCPPSIICGSISMLSAVNFDCQLCRTTSEVDNVGSNYQLTRKRRPEPRETPPKQALGLSRVAAKAPCPGREMFWYPPHRRPR
jgi:hypothetical protein